MAKWTDVPSSVRPMLASLEEPPIAQQGLVYEPKYDGMRALADVRPPARAGMPAQVALVSRNGREKQTQFPEITAALAALVGRIGRPVLVDGEVVAIDATGHPLGFQHVQGRIHLTRAADIASAARTQPTVLVLFDLIRDGDEDLRDEPLATRRLRLQEIFRMARLRANGTVRLSEVVADDGSQMLARAREEGWEGLIVKGGMSTYRSGKRTPAWRKLKLLKQQEFVIGGWTEPRESRQHFGSLLVGYYDAFGSLRWAGGVGTGFNQAELDRVARLLASREIKKRPFADTFATMEPARWVRPELVAEIRFAEWTSDGLLRQPVYLGMRSDKKARDVARELPAKVDPPAISAAGRHRRNRRTEEPRSASAQTPPSTRTKAKRVDPTPVKLPNAADRQTLLDRLTELERARRDGDLVVPGGGTLRVTNLSKVFWPSQGITKGELLRYYVEVSPLILPSVSDRPLVMKRFPNGIQKLAFYQQRHPDTPPAGVRREVLPPEVDPIDEEGPRDRLIGGSVTTLLYMTQIAAISQDPWFSRVTDPLHPDYVAIDLDPGEGAGFDRVLDVARWVKEELDFYDVPAWPKTSGSRGLHIYIPLPPGTTYESGQLLCQVIATVVSSKHPRVATIERMVKRRPRGTVYVDYLQNILGKTLATAYSARASDYAGVSTPLTWREVERGVNPHDFTIRTAPARFRKVGDLWEPFRASPPVNLKSLLRRHAR